MKKDIYLEKGEENMSFFKKRGRRVLSFALAIIMVCSSLPFSVFAEDSFSVQATDSEDLSESDESQIVDSGSITSYTGDEIGWSLDSEGTLTIFGEGTLQANCTYATASSDIPWESYASDGKIKKVTVSDGIVALHGTYFKNCKSLESVELSDSVERISYLFYGCSKLKTVKLSKSLVAIGASCFRNCTSLKNLTFYEGLEVVGSSAFNGCTSLESVILPDSVTTIESYAFFKCSSMKELKLSSSLEEIIYYAFPYCSSLESVVIPASVKTIGDRVFEDCTALNDVKIEGGYITLGRHIFDDTAIYSNPDYIKDGCLIIDGCLFKEVEYGATSLCLDESVTCIASCWYNDNTKFQTITVKNKDCVYADVTPTFPISSIIKGPVNSTTQTRAKKSGNTFVPICLCGTSECFGETYGYCDGTVGYTAGEWCENCQLWVSGHEKKYEFSHIDENEDEICDYCGRPIEESVINLLKVGDDLTAYLMSDGALYIVGSGDMYDFTKKMNIETTDVKVKSVTFSNKVLHIGNYAFAGMNLIESVTLSPILVSIGKNAFANCVALKEMELTGSEIEIGEYAFYKCSALSALDLSEDVKSVGDYAFEYCKGLEEVYIARATFGEGAFYGCTGLKTVTYTQRYNSKYIENYQFYGCTSLEEVKISDWLVSIGNRAFVNCKKLKEININNCLSTLGQYAFYGCASLESIEIPKKIPEVRAAAFANCTSLKTVTFAERTSKIEIDSSAFSGCTSLENVELDEHTTQIYSSAFSGCTSLKSIVIPESVTSIHRKTFYGCKNLEKIEILNDNIWICPPVKENRETYVTVPKTTTIKANVGSKGDTYAYENDLEFETLSDDIKAVSYAMKQSPTKDTYKLGSDTAFSPDGAILTVTYSDGSTRDVKHGYTVDWSQCDLTAVGEYTAKLIYFGCGFEFDITVVSDEVYVGVPESRTFYVFCSGSKYGHFKFVPEETRQYTFCLDDASASVTIDGKCYSSKNPNGVRYIRCDLEAGTEYDFEISQGKGYVRITEIDDVYYKIRDDGTYEAYGAVIDNYGGTVTIPAEYGGKPVTSIAINFLCDSGYIKPKPDQVIISEGVKEIGEQAFYKYQGTVSLPDSIEKIGSSAFYGANITEINIGANIVSVGEKAFSHCTKLETVNILAKNAEYKAGVFSYCSALENVYIADGITELGEEMFSYCTALKKVTGAKDLKKISDYMFGYCDLFEDPTELLTTVEEIDNYAFNECGNIKKLIFGDSVKTIGKYAFVGCANVTEIVLSNSIETIKEGAFSGTGIEKFELPSTISTFYKIVSSCKNLKEVTLPEHVTSIPYNAFYGCSALETVHTKGKITSISDNAFRQCRALKNVDFFDTVETIGENAFAYCDSLTEVSLPKIKILSRYAFSSAKALEKIDISSEGAVIDVRAFEYCTALKEATIAKNCEVGGNTFYGCTALETVTFGKGVSLGYSTLENCTALKDVYIYIVSVNKPTLGNISENVTIHGYIGSGAQKLAEENGYAFEIIEGHSHSFSVTTEETTSCRQPAYNVYTCDCGYSYKEKIRSSEYKHYYSGDYTVDKNPTCTQPGLKSKHCYCKKERADISIIEPYGHTEVIDIPAIAPTETAAGYTQKSHCATCGEILCDVTEISAPEYTIEILDDGVKAEKFDYATVRNDGEYVAVMFSMRKDICVSEIDKTVIYKVGEVKLSKTNFAYNGKNQYPTVSVKDSTGETLTPGTDYTLAYPEMSKYGGVYSVKVSFIGNYAGSKTLEYTITMPTAQAKITSYSSTSATLSLGGATSDLGYAVYKVDASGKYIHLANTSKSTYTVSALTPGTGYKFAVRVYAKDNSAKAHYGSYSTAVACTTKPSSSFTLKSSSTSSTITLNWTKAKGATGYRIFRYDSASKSYVKVKDVTSNSYTFKKLKNATTYKYAVKAYTKRQDGKTIWGENLVKITAATAPAKTNITSLKFSGGKVTLKWKNISGESGYQVYYSTKKNSGYKLLATTKANTAKVTKKLASGKTYYFKVRAYKTVSGKTVYGEFSAVKSVKTK